ncbi:MAG: hypothetical protein COV99_06200 [Bacteroidetes bacterium CG12_big_fil_rev_8_21_14_0_65_60_17]|nr:MAG: hypothetical protein COV99_06200 [Bacteroidetes bacterium CG12_big_fil_rev_8_21_14_0_65_60_17]
MQRIPVLLLALSLAACNMETGTGPTGPPGPPGNANVFSLNFVFSMDDAEVNGSVASVQYDVPDLTPLVVDEGGVLMFFRDQGTWTAMPWTIGVESADLPAVDYTISLGFGYDAGFLEVFYEASTPAIDLLNEPDREVKLVVIDGSVFGKKAVDLQSWESVKAAYDL